MGRIHQLNEETINQIAAGEVIERPASVVKELVENSLDAGATKIEVFLEEGGKSFIQVKDNGSGIHPEDFNICFQRFTTSKIQKAEDIFYISSNGFRGEALSSIASVSRLELTSRTKENQVARFVEVSGGAISLDEEVAREVGTTISVHNLFYNTPVRLKFLSSPSAEVHRVSQMILRLALANPEVRFRLTHNGKDLLHARSSKPKERIGELLGSKWVPELLEVDYGGEDSWVLKGFLGTEKISRARREHQYFFLDRRPIQNPSLLKAVEKAFHTFFPGRYPVGVFHLDLPPETYDVNVHPTKKEVRFHQESTVFSFIYQGIRQTLKGQNPESGFQLPSSLQMKPAQRPSALESLEDLILQEKPPEKTEVQDLFAQPEFQSTVPFPKSSIQAPTLEESDSPLVPFLQVNRQFLLVEIKDQILLIDQYNAHFRVLYEEYLKRLQEGQHLSAQQLMFPEVLEFSLPEAQLLEEQIDRLYKLGFDLSPFGGNTYKLNGLPTDLEESRGKQVLLEFIAQLQEVQPKNPLEHFALCFASSRAFRKGDTLNLEQMNELFDQLMATQNPYLSPHGKPTFIPWQLEDLEKKFN